MSNHLSPRRFRLDLAVPGEVAIREAVASIQIMGADVRLAEVAVLLDQALDKLGDYVDDQIKSTKLG